MKFKKGFIQPMVIAAVGMLSTMSLGATGAVLEATAPNENIVEAILAEKSDKDLAKGIVDGLTREQRAAAIDAYFGQWNLPLAGHGMTFVTEADKYETVDWRLVAAIAMRESTGCKFAFAKNNCFGWGKRVTFSTVDIAIAEITRHLAGDNEKTSHHYAGKDTQGILAKYNSVIPEYTNEILAIMNNIQELVPEDENSVNSKLVFAR